MGVFAYKNVQGTFKVMWDVERSFVVWDSPKHSEVSHLFHSSWQPSPPPPAGCPIVEGNQKLLSRIPELLSQVSVGSHGNLDLLITLSVGSYSVGQRNWHIFRIINSFYLGAARTFSY